MAEKIKSSGIIVGEDKRPKVNCPKCKSTIVMDLKLFIDDVTKVVESNCPKCGAKLFTALLIVIHPDLKGLYHCIQICMDALQAGTVRLT